MYYRFKLEKDTFITSQSEEGNFGRDPILEVGKIVDNSVIYPIRSLIKFNVDDINNKISTNKINSSSVFELSMYECLNENIYYDNFWIDALLISRSWTEGTGSLAEKSTGSACNWISASNDDCWSLPGGDYLTVASASQYYATSSGDITMDITELVGYLTASVYPNCGLIIKLRDEIGDQFLTSGSQYFIVDGNDVFYLTERSAPNENFNRKMFYGKDTHTIYYPTIVAKWNDTLTTASISASSTWQDYCVSLREPKEEYISSERIRFELFGRLKYPVMTYSTRSLENLSSTVLTDLTYEVKDVSDYGRAILPYSVYTSCSYDASKNYFNIDMSALPVNRTYELSVKHEFLGTTKIYKLHKFRIV